MPTLPKAGRYELLEELGRGAMGVVYKAHDPVIGRSVAVKTLRLSEEGTGMTHEELIARFQTEARAAGLLTHPNIVVVYDAGEEEGLFYIIMEHIAGRSLQALLDARQSFPLPRVLRLMEQACLALEYAHQHNVVHRDIKPANLMLTPDDTLKVTDFGTAKILQFGSAQTAQIIGTPSYMSPEQVKGKAVDGRSDIFSLGVILYELATGEKPFPGQNITTVIYKIINEDPVPPRVLDSSVHPGLSCVITRALAKEPGARYASCRELMEALRNYRELGASPEATVAMPGRGPGARQTPPAAMRPAGVAAEARPPKKRGSAWLTLLLLALVAGAGYRLWPHVRDVWQRSRDTLAPGAPAAPGSSQAPADPAAATPEALRPSQLSPAAKVPAPRKGSEAPPPNSPAAELKSRIEQRLAEAGLGAKVQIHATGNTITLSGRLLPREHRQLLHLLRDAPSWVRLIDHIEYASREPGENSSELSSEPSDRAQRRAGSEQGPASMGTGVLVSTTPEGARILVDGMSIRQRTPALLQLSEGEHTLTLVLKGFGVARRTIMVEENQPLQVRVTLH